MRAIEAAELRWRKTTQAAGLIAVVGVVLGLVALVVAFVR